MPLLEVKDLDVHYNTVAGTVRAVDGVSLTLEQGEVLGLVGESGCGKTTLATSIMKLLPFKTLVRGQLLFRGQNLVTKSDKEMARIRGREIALITQSAMNALDPVQRAGHQIVEAIRAHRRCPKSEARSNALHLLEMVGLEEKRLRSFPHELSGGQRQRVIIAMALASQPQLVIADEPTTGLDVIAEYRILEHLSSLQRKLHLSIIFISHDISTTAQLADRIAIMYAGQIMEYGPVSEVLKDGAYHPYTLGLRNAFPDIQDPKKDLVSIPGTPWDLLVVPTGCRFYDRCPFRALTCEVKEPERFKISEDHFVLCHFPERAEEFRNLSTKRDIWLMNLENDR